jgi:heptosyltransferase II
MELSKPALSSIQPTNIIIRMPNWIGDAVMATPILADIRNRWKTAKITVMCQGSVGTILLHDPHIDHIYSFKKPSGWIHRFHRTDIIETLREGDYDLGILLTNSLSSAWWFWRGDVRKRIGFANGMRNALLTTAVPYPENMEAQHQVITYKHLLRPLGIPISCTEPKIYVSPEEMQEAYRLLKLWGVDPKEHIIVGINPGAAYGSAKCWPPERYQEVTKKLLANPHLFIIYFGDEPGAPLVNEICKQFDNRVINLAGRTSLRELIALINCCSIFLTNDSGPMHLAAALGIKLLALFGSTNDVKTGPFPAGKVIHKHVECSPCYKRTCPIDFRCMMRITVDEVYDELKQMLDNYH